MGIKIDLTGVPEAGEYSIIPAGSYVMTCTECFTKDENGADLHTKNLDPMWKLVLTVDPTEKYAGQKVFDHIIFGGKQALKSRVKLILSRLGGKKTDGAVEIEPSDFVGKRCRVTIVEDEYEGKKNNKVAFDGYDHLDAAPKNGGAAAVAQDTPF